MTLWKNIGNTNYSISNDGNIRNDVTGKVLKLSKDTQGYLKTNLSIKGKLKTVSVHKLVAEAFIPKPDNIDDITVDHINSVKTDNNYKNLQWLTRADNTIKGVSKEFTLVSPEGVKVNVYNLRQFCKDNNLDAGAMNKVANGKANKHKGWTKHTV